MDTYDERRQDESIWIGLPHVRPNQGNTLLDGAVGAYVPTLALASSIEDYVDKVTTFLDEYGFCVLEILDVELFDERMKRCEVDPGLRTLVGSLGSDAPVAFYVFNTYENDPDE